MLERRRRRRGLGRRESALHDIVAAGAVGVGVVRLDTELEHLDLRDMKSGVVDVIFHHLDEAPVDADEIRGIGDDDRQAGARAAPRIAGEQGVGRRDQRRDDERVAAALDQRTVDAQRVEVRDVPAQGHIGARRDGGLARPERVDDGIVVDGYSRLGSDRLATGGRGHFVGGGVLRSRIELDAARTVVRHWPHVANALVDHDCCHIWSHTPRQRDRAARADGRGVGSEATDAHAALGGD